MTTDRPMRVLVACEFTGVVRRAFAARGHDAWSCDLVDSEDRSNKHIVGDARDLLDQDWDLLIVCHPPCTRLCLSGIRWLTAPPPGRTLAAMWTELEEAARLFSAFWNAPIERIAIENPVMHRHAKQRIAGYQDPHDVVHPWQHGHGETKRMCLWLKNLPRLKPTQVVEGRTARVHRMSPGGHRYDRRRERSRFYSGVADAMAAQWGSLYWLPEPLRPTEGDRSMSAAGTVVITIAPAHDAGGRATGLFSATRTIVTGSSTPLADAARSLLAEGTPADTVLVMRHAGRDHDAIRTTVGAAAGLTVWNSAEGKPVFTRWRPDSRFGTEKTPAAPSGSAVDGVGGTGDHPT